MVSGVQAKLVEQGVRERGPNTRCADQDAAPVLGETFPPQTAHRLRMVGKCGGRGSMTSIDRNGTYYEYLTASHAIFVHQPYTNPATFPAVPECCWCEHSDYLKGFETTANTPNPADSFAS